MEPVSEAMETIAINRDLYNELRIYCDSNGIRLRDFIEESLETATYRDEIEKLLSDAQWLRERMELIKKESTRVGFSRGVLAATLNLSGFSEVSRCLTPEATRDEVDFRPVTGGQMSLFHG